MTITQLEYLIAVDTYNSFVDASEHCYVTQPTLSMQIQKLEDELGILLFDRTKKPVITTQLGRKIVDQAKNIIRESSRIQDLISLEKKDKSGELRIGVIPTIAPYLVPLFLAALNEQLPKVDIDIQEMLSSQILECLQEGNLDAGILSFHNNKNYNIRPLYYEEFMLYTSNNHKYSSQDDIDADTLNTNDLWMLSDGHCFKDQIKDLCGGRIEQNKFSKIQFKGGNFDTLKKLVDYGMGYTLLPELMYKEKNNKESKQFKQFSKAKRPFREVSIVLHKNYLKENLIDVLENVIKSVIPEHMKKTNRGKVLAWNG